MPGEWTNTAPSHALTSQGGKAKEHVGMENLREVEY